MRVLRVRNVHEALPKSLEILARDGVRRESRNGPVLMLDEPVATVYERPCERVLFHPWRDANPFFHFYESLWMLAGRNDVAPLARYVDRMRTFSDDGVTLNAAYGARWRDAEIDCYNGGGDPPRRDQLAVIVARLRANKDDRRCVLQIWDHRADLRTLDEPQTKDAACNVAATLQIGGDGRLDMTLLCRSNDAIWGANGANAVHFSMMQEYVARSVGVEVGTFTQISVNWHAYEDVFRKTLDARHLWVRDDRNAAESSNPYVEEVIDGGDMQIASQAGAKNVSMMPDTVEPYPLMSVSRELWDRDCRAFVTNDGMLPRNADRASFDEPFFRDVAWPIVLAHDIYKNVSAGDGRFAIAMMAASDCAATDWRRACVEWLERRHEAHRAKTENQKNYGADGSGGW